MKFNEFCTESTKFVEYFEKKMVFEPATCCVRGKDVHTAPWGQLYLQI